MREYKTLHCFGYDEYIIEKSQFIGYAKPVLNEEEARDFIEEIKKKHKNATHNVWAYTIGLDMNIQRYSDDGEPQGTAGIPILEFIKKEDLRNVVVVVTRYFGGIKLGAGGLVRAYTKGAKIGISKAKIVVKKMFEVVEIIIDYTLLGKVQNELKSKSYHIFSIEYLENVNLSVYCEKERLVEFIEFLTEITNAKAEIKEKGKIYLSVENKNILI